MRFPVLASTILALCLTGCSSPTKAKVEPEKKKEQNHAFNDAAKYLAGIKGRSGGGFEALEREAVWQKHSTQMDSLWMEFNKSYLGPAREFQKRELASTVAYNDTVFYPLSGPDVPFELTFFPKGKTFIMAGLEPVGPVPTPAEFAPGKGEKVLVGIREAAADMFGRSFFVTSHMDQQFRGQVTRGLLPMLFLLLARTGCEVVDARHVMLAPDGTLQASNEEKPRGVEIQFKRPDGVDAKLIYFSTDLAKGLETDPRFLNMVDKFGAHDTFVKSGSFLLHWRMCDRLRAHILETSKNVLQDDTGVPYSYFVKAGWDVRLFGDYRMPDPPFRAHYQKDLAKAIADPAKVKPLGFSLGYGARKRPTPLILAIRPAGAAPAQAAAKK